MSSVDKEPSLIRYAKKTLAHATGFDSAKIAWLNSPYKGHKRALYTLYMGLSAFYSTTSERIYDLSTRKCSKCCYIRCI